MSVISGHYQNRNGVWLQNKFARIFIQNIGGMTPEFSVRTTYYGKENWLNTHWNPHFRAHFNQSAGISLSASAESGDGDLLSQVAGTF
ncbi:hypothetical protein ACE1BJ_24535, partial [Aeromonas jandaei]